VRIKESLIRYRVLVGIVTLLLCVVTFAISAHAGGGGFKAHPLAGSSPEELGHVALQYTQGMYPSLSGTSQVVLVRPVTTKEVGTLGLGYLDFASIETPPLMLVIIKGDFDTSNTLASIYPSTKSKWRSQYIGYVFDMWAGVPSLTITSPQGGAFRKVLNDPTLPAKPPGDNPASVPPPMPPEHKTLHYGAVAPGVAMPPSSSNK